MWGHPMVIDYLANSSTITPNLHVGSPYALLVVLEYPVSGNGNFGVTLQQER